MRQNSGAVHPPNVLRSGVCSEARTLDSLTRGFEAEPDALVVSQASLAGRLLLGGSGEPGNRD
jgi:hypothetical protein